MTKVLLGFLVGVGVGAGIALLSAPATGHELRAQLRTRADADYQKLGAEWRNGMQQVRSRLDRKQSDLDEFDTEPGQEEAHITAQAE